MTMVRLKRCQRSNLGGWIKQNVVENEVEKVKVVQRIDLHQRHGFNPKEGMWEEPKVCVGRLLGVT